MRMGVKVAFERLQVRDYRAVTLYGMSATAIMLNGNY